jgi:hypothetical protein
MIKLRLRLAVAGCVVALTCLAACGSPAGPPTPVALIATAAPPSATTVAPQPAATPTAAALPAATDLPEPTATLVPTPLPTAEPLPAGWMWYENSDAGFRLAHPEAWTMVVNWQLGGNRPSSQIIYRATFQSVETGSSVVLDIWNLRGRRDEDLLQWVNSQPDAAIFDVADEPLTTNATVLGRPAVFHYHPARGGTSDFVVTLFVAGQQRYRVTFNSAMSPGMAGDPQIYRMMLESLQIFGQPGGPVEIPTGWEMGAGLVIDTRPVETAAGETVDLATAPQTPLGGLEGTLDSWQEATPPAFRFTLLTDAGERYVIRGEAFRVHFRGEPIDHRFNSAIDQPQPGERVWVSGRLIAPDEVVAGDVTIERDGLTQTWFSQTLIEITPDWEGDIPSRFVLAAAGVPHLWLRGPVAAMAGLLVDEAEPPVLPAAWQPYADRTALAYGVVNPDANGRVEIEQVFVQDGPCDVTPATTHCQAWLQILP